MTIRRTTPKRDATKDRSPAGKTMVQQARDRRKPVDLGRALIEAFLTNERINQVLLDSIDATIWRAMPSCSARRNIATTFAHMHNVRCMRLKMSAREHPQPERLDRSEVTIDQARRALVQSAKAMADLIRRSLEAGGHVPELRPDVVAMVCGSIVHDAHHRGQICHWAHLLGKPLNTQQQLRMWEWDKRWQEVLAG